MKLPWIKFFPSDWLSDESLRSCSIGARGLWMDLLAMMAKSNTHGFLLIGGSPASVEQISRIIGEDPQTTRKLLEELESNGVFSRDEKNVVFSRRMRRDEAVRESDRERQIRHRAKNPEPKKECPKRDVSPKSKKPSREEWLEYAKTIKGWNAGDAEKAFDYYEANGWKVGGRTAVVDWKACARNCARRSDASDVRPKIQIAKPAPKSSCDSPRPAPIDYSSVDVVVGLIGTAVKEGLSIPMLQAMTPKNVWEKAFQMANANKEAVCRR
jgi:hypothetical protein